LIIALEKIQNWKEFSRAGIKKRNEDIMAQRIVLTFDLHKPRAKGNPYREISRKLDEIGLKKSTKSKLPHNFYAYTIKGEDREKDIKELRGKYIRKVRKIIKQEHPGKASIFLMVGETWASRNTKK
jgi:hypothetical protein